MEHDGKVVYPINDVDSVIGFSEAVSAMIDAAVGDASGLLLDRLNGVSRR